MRVVVLSVEGLKSACRDRVLKSLTDVFAARGAPVLPEAPEPRGTAPYAAALARARGLARLRGATVVLSEGTWLRACDDEATRSTLDALNAALTAKLLPGAEVRHAGLHVRVPVHEAFEFAVEDADSRGVTVRGLAALDEALARAAAAPPPGWVVRSVDGSAYAADSFADVAAMAREALDLAAGAAAADG